MEKVYKCGGLKLLLRGDIMEITFIQTGGTIDKDYAQKAKVYNFEISEPAVKRMLRRFNPNFRYKVISVLRKDSMDITKEDREKIYAVCKNAKNDRIIITHGTDTMVETAKRLRSIRDKTIVLVGASKPEKFYDSDAPFNLGTAIGAINVLNKGVYIAMNGRIYTPHKCKKQEETGRFIDT